MLHRLDYTAPNTAATTPTDKRILAFAAIRVGLLQVGRPQAGEVESGTYM